MANISVCHDIPHIYNTGTKDKDNIDKEDAALLTLESIYDEVDYLWGSGVATGKLCTNAANLESIFDEDIEKGICNVLRRFIS